jgi:integrase
MKKEYVVFQMKRPTKEKGTGHKMWYYKLALKNQHSNERKVLPKEYYLHTDKSRIETYDVAPKGSYRATQNKIAFQRLNDCIRDIERMRDDDDKTWYSWFEEEESVVSTDELTDIYFDSIPYLLGTQSKLQVNRYIKFVDNHLPFLKKLKHKGACQQKTYKSVLNKLKVLKDTHSVDYLKKHWESFTKSTKMAFDLKLSDTIPMSNMVPEKFWSKTKTDVYIATEDELKALDNVDLINHKNLRYTTMSSRLKYEDIRKAFMFSAIYTGIRPQSLEIMKWKQIKEEKGYLRINVDPNKEGVADYWLYCSLDAYEYLGKRGDDEDYVFAYYPRVGVGGYKNNLSKSASLSKAFKSICQHAGIDNVKLTLQQCRHTHALKTLQSTNNDMMKVSKRLGHKSMVTTEMHYARFLEDYQEDTCNEVMQFDKYQTVKK